MECLIHSPAFNTVKMAWVAGVGGAVQQVALAHHVLEHRQRRGLTAGGVLVVQGTRQCSPDEATPEKTPSTSFKRPTTPYNTT